MSKDLFSLPTVPRRYRRQGVTGYSKPHATAEQLERIVDEYGLSWTIYGKYPKLSRFYINMAIEFFGASKTIAPAQQRLGTGPELVIYGGLLDRKFSPWGRGQRSFVFQSAQLGGRELPGGAVVDFVVNNAGDRIGVRVQGKFHALDNPFRTGGAKTEEDHRQRMRLEAAGWITWITDVNKSLELELGPDKAVTNEFDRILSGRDYKWYAV